jgi:hypothetical protein
MLETSFPEKQLVLLTTVQNVVVPNGKNKKAAQTCSLSSGRFLAKGLTKFCKTQNTTG